MAKGWVSRAVIAGAVFALLPGAGFAAAGEPAAESLPAPRSAVVSESVPTSAPAAVPAPVAGQAAEPLATRLARQPSAVRAFVKRRLECNHWGGEEPYSKARARQIARATQRLVCDNLDRDEARLRQRYSTDAELPALLDAVRDAWEL